VVQERSDSGTVAIMQWRDVIRLPEISCLSESGLAFILTPSRTNPGKTVLPLQHSYAKSLQAMDFMKLLPQSEEIRRNMVDSQLRTSGVNTAWIISAMLATAREAFVPGDASAAYMDRSVPLGEGRMLNPPIAAGQMLEIAEPRPSDHVLLIAAGTGYLAALLAGRVTKMVAVEEAQSLADAFKANCPDMILVEGPNAAGAAEHGPYDLIIIDGAIETLPDALTEQLVEGGRIVTGVIEGPVSRLASGVKRGSHLALRAMADMEIAPLPSFAQAREFVF
jgi:protein-L-isoaspartate(D-aspartate) O-methyltransferase